jgi:hypothetical protein
MIGVRIMLLKSTLNSLETVFGSGGVVDEVVVTQGW